MKRERPKVEPTESRESVVNRSSASAMMSKMGIVGRPEPSVPLEEARGSVNQHVKTGDGQVVNKFWTDRFPEVFQEPSEGGTQSLRPSESDFSELDELEQELLAGLKTPEKSELNKTSQGRSGSFDFDQGELPGDLKDLFPTQPPKVPDSFDVFTAASVDPLQAPAPVTTDQELSRGELADLMNQLDMEGVPTQEKGKGMRL